MERVALYAVLVLALAACSRAAIAVGPADLGVKVTAIPTAAVASTSSAASHSLKWLSVIGTATGGDCPSTCKAAGLVAVTNGYGSTLCAFNQTLLAMLGDGYRTIFDSGIKPNGDGCYYFDTFYNTPAGRWAPSTLFKDAYKCGCAKNGTFSWRPKATGCRTTELNTYGTCRVTSGQGASTKAWIGEIFTVSSGPFCFYVEAPGTKALVASSAYDLLCDTKIQTSGGTSTIPTGRNGPISRYNVTSNDCAATCKAKGMAEVGSGTPGLSLCTRVAGLQHDLGVASNGAMSGNTAKGCFFAGVISSATNPATKCPQASSYQCYCQSTTTSKQPVWVPKAQAGAWGGSRSSVCKKWTAVPDVEGSSTQFVCRVKDSAGKWVLGNLPGNPNRDFCTVPGPATGFYSVCGQVMTSTAYEVLCEQT